MMKNEMAKVSFKVAREIVPKLIGMCLKKDLQRQWPQSAMVDQECTCFFHWSTSLDKVNTRKHQSWLAFQHKQLWKDYKDTKTIDDANTKYHMIIYGDCHMVMPWKKIFWSLQVVGVLTFLLHAMECPYDSRQYITEQYRTIIFIFDYVGNICNQLQFGWYSRDMSINEWRKMPTCSLVEKVHNKWLQQSGNKITCMYEATMDDLIQALMQIANYRSWLKGNSIGKT